MDFISKTSLQKYLDDNKIVRLDEQSVIKIILQVIEAVKYLHLNNIVHRDIKLQNILITTD